jgi:hypothetical protein
MLNSQPSCPVDEMDRQWIGRALIWFERKLGADFIKSREYLLLQNHTFEYQDFSSDEAIRYFIGFICNYIDLDPAIIGFQILMNDDIELADGIRTTTYKEEFERKSWPDENGNYEISLSTKRLEDPQSAFISIAYQLVYLKLLRDGVFTFANGYMIDYAMVLFGFGIIQANGCVRSGQWQTVSHQVWRVRKLGHMNQRMFGYLLALLTKYRKDWYQFYEYNLCPDVKKYYQTSRAFLDNAESSAIEVGSIVNDEAVFIKKRFYDNGRISQFSHLSSTGLDGLTVFYHQNGKLWSERVYKNNIPYTVVSNYDSDGDPVEKGTLYNGNGTLYIYGSDGRLDIIEKYENEKLLESIKQFKP